MPSLHNRTPFVLEGVPLIDKFANNLFVIIVKASYEVSPAGALKISEVQESIRFKDEYFGDPQTSELQSPSDCVYYKPAAEFLIPEPSNLRDRLKFFGWKVSVQIGPVKKSERVSKVWPFGPLRRDKKPRSQYAGTYDQHWVKSRMPLLPIDFDDRFNLATPKDQHIPGYLKGDEHVKIVGLYPEGDCEFILPGRTILVAGNVMSRYFTEVAALDTMIISPDVPKFTLVWRLPIHCRKVAEVCSVYVDLIRSQIASELFGKP